MKTKFLWLIVVAALLLGIVLYRSYESRDDLNVTPEAAKEIEKAKRR